MDEVEIRAARPGEFAAAARLRWDWAVEVGAEPVGTRDEFTATFGEWARTHTDSHRCLVLVRGGTVIGMAWLAVTLRVPTPNSIVRSAGDVQCVYLVPGERDSGLGGRLIDAVLRLAVEIGVERVTVHSSVRAVSAYTRHGFAVSDQLLHVEPGR